MHTILAKQTDGLSRKDNSLSQEEAAAALQPCATWHSGVIQEKFERSRDLIRQGYPAGNVFLVVSGWAMRHRILENGTRQILGFAIPGDIIGIPGMYVRDSLYTVSTLTDLVALRLPQSVIVATATRDRELTAQILMMFARESLMLAEHLTELSRKSAYDRVGHLLLELHYRSFRDHDAGLKLHWMPVTQEMIGDTVGLSAVHVSRTLTRFRTEGTVEAKPGSVAVRDVAALAKSTGYEFDYVQAIQDLRDRSSALAANLAARAPVPRKDKASSNAAFAAAELRKTVGHNSAEQLDTKEGIRARALDEKREICLQLLKGEPLSILSARTGIPEAQLEIWRLRAQVALNTALAVPEGLETHPQLGPIRRRVDELGVRVTALERRTCI